MHSHQTRLGMYIVSACLTLTGLASATLAAQADSQPNVLFLAMDDLNDWVACLGGHPDVRTPNLDRLAHRGVLFTQAHCVSPLCGPSRSAIFTGQRGETTGVYHNRGNVTDYVPDAVLLSQHFMANGYHALGAGKLIHPSGNVVPSAFDEFGPGAGCVGGPFTPEEIAMKNMTPTHLVDRGPGKLRVVLPLARLSFIDNPTNEFSTFDWGPLDVTDEDMADGKVARWGVEQLQRSFDKPFFLGVGTYRPHQPLFTPRKYFEYYPLDRITLPPAYAGDLEDIPAAGRDLALVPWASGRHRTVMEHNQWRQAVQGYLAAVTFADAQIGKVLDALDASPYADNTLIVLWGDHGWHLGEKEHWGKHTPWQRSTHTPLIIVPARNAQPAGYQPGRRCDATVSLLDIYPTLIEMCGLPQRPELEGRSLAPLVDDPAMEWDEVAVSSVGRGTISIRTRQWRYIHYFDGSEELYDVRVDPNELFNLAGEARYADVKKQLARHIPIDNRFKQFVRWGRWKAIFCADGKVMLFDIPAAHGVSEQFEVSKEHPEIVARIVDYLKTNQITDRYVSMPEDVESDKASDG